MRYIRLTSGDSPIFENAMQLYHISFPAHEQRESKSQEFIMEHRDYCFTVVLDQDEFVGAILYWETNTFIYVEHFFIDPARRNSGYGREILKWLSAKKKTVILEIDPPVDEIAVRRKGFYERAGFVANPFPHIHPPYLENTPGHKLVVMSCPAQLSEDVYNEFNSYLKETVMAQ